MILGSADVMRCCPQKVGETADCRSSLRYRVLPPVSSSHHWRPKCPPDAELGLFGMRCICDAQDGIASGFLYDLRTWTATLVESSCVCSDPSRAVGAKSEFSGTGIFSSARTCVSGTVNRRECDISKSAMRGTRAICASGRLRPSKQLAIQVGISPFGVQSVPYIGVKVQSTINFVTHGARLTLGCMFQVL